MRHERPPLDDHTEPLDERPGPDFPFYRGVCWAVLISGVLWAAIIFWGVL
jgi:hypothetical protein